MSTATADSSYDEDLDGPADTLEHTDMDGTVTKIAVNPLTGRPKRPKKQSSFAAVVADLEVGESASRVHHLNQDMTLAEFERDLSEMKSMIQNNVRPATVNAKQTTGGEYRIETSQTITTAGRIYLLAIVTRVS